MLCVCPLFLAILMIFFACLCTKIILYCCSVFVCACVFFFFKYFFVCDDGLFVFHVFTVTSCLKNILYIYYPNFIQFYVSFIENIKIRFHDISKLHKDKLCFLYFHGLLYAYIVASILRNKNISYVALELSLTFK